MNTEKILIPFRRFPNYHNEKGWKKYKLNDIASVVNDKCSGANLCIDTYISTENILPNYGGIKIASKLPSTGTFTRFKKGDVLFSNIRPYLKKVWWANFDGVASNDIIVFRALTGFDACFISHIIKSDAFITYSMKGAKGVKMPRGDRDMMLQYDVYVPNIEEQKEIAVCLQSIVSYISSINEKVDQLKAHKTSLLQKLFPQNGKNVPEYRFPEFQEDNVWEKKEFKEVIKVNSGRDYKHLSSGNIPVYGTGGYMLSVDGKLSDKDAVGVGRKGTIDRPQYLKAPFWTVDTLFFLTNCDGYDIEFIYFLSQIIPWKKYGEQTGVPSLSKNSIEELEVVVPTNIKEQKKIARALFSLDEGIMLLEKKMSVLESHKNGLMQQLFPQI